MFQGNPDRYLKPLFSAPANQDAVMSRYAVCVRCDRLGRPVRAGDWIDMTRGTTSPLRKVVKSGPTLVLETRDGGNEVVDARAVKGVVVGEFSELVRRGGN